MCPSAIIWAPIDLERVDVCIAHPSEPTDLLLSLDFLNACGTTTPAGSIVRFSGAPTVTAWNACVLDIDLIYYTSVDGDEVAAGIEHIDAGPTQIPIAIAVVNDMIVEVRIVHQP